MSRPAMERIGKADGEGNPVPDMPPPDGSGRPNVPPFRPALAQPVESAQSGIPQSELLEALDRERVRAKAEKRAKARAELPPTTV